MCGIAGRVNFLSGAPVERAYVQRMCDLLAHRGPDGDGVLVDGAAGFGHRRVAVIDLPEGRQPMATADRTVWLTFNGEIYNFLELRADLERRGHRFRTESDTEVLLAAYRQFGIECLSRLRGMFAFAIWDAGTRTLFMARDRVGKKPLHYTIDGDGIAFASEPKAFLADPAFAAQPNLEALSHYLTYQYVPSPMSAFQGVSKLLPGHYLLVRDGRVTIQRYWKLRYEPKRPISEEAACEELLAKMTEAVRLRLRSDVPVGAFLSGGIDSSAVVAIMAQLSPNAVPTFSIGFEERDYDELEYARLVARRYATDHHELVVRPDAIRVLPQLVWHYNEPFADESAIPTYYLAQFARRHVTVALNGEAGDENFAGYRRYVPDPMLTWYDRVPTPVRRTVQTLANAFPADDRSARFVGRLRGWLERAAESRERRYARRVIQFNPRLKARLCTEEFLEAAGPADSIELLLAEYRDGGVADFLDATLDVDVARYLPDCLLVKVDVATMAHGLEGRSPFADHLLMEFIASLPSSMKLRGATGKYLLRKTMRPFLPLETIGRRKMGFGAPLEHWFRGDLRTLAGDVLLSSRATQRGYFHPPVIRRLLDEHGQGGAQWHDQLWNLLMLELWHRMFIDERPTGPPAQIDLLASADVRHVA